MSKNTICWSICMVFSIAFGVMGYYDGKGFYWSTPWLAACLILAGLEQKEKP